MRVPILVGLFDQLYYARAPAIAKPDGSNVQPGFCGFTDRAMTVADPNMVLADAESFPLHQDVMYGNGSTIRSEATMSGGSVKFQNKQAFSMQVTSLNDKQLKVVAGTKPKAIAGK